MFLLYLSSCNAKNIGGGYKTVVRAELVSESRTIVHYYRFKNCGQDQAKLKSAAQFVEEFIVPLQVKNEVDLTIYLDGHELAFDYDAAKEGNFTETDYPEDWSKLMNVLSKFKLLVFLKEKGVLSGSMREELKKYIISIAKQYNSIA